MEDAEQGRPRPRFGFDEALDAARAVLSLADRLTAPVGALAAGRDRAVRSWSGPWGEELRARAGDEDRNLEAAVAACHTEAGLWADAWCEAVDRTNGVVFAEACAEQRAFLAGREPGSGDSDDPDDAYNRDGWETNDLFDEWGDEVIDPPLYQLRYLAPAMAGIERPQLVAAPTADNRFDGGRPFARYRRDGDQLVLDRAPAPPPRSRNRPSRVAYRAWLRGLPPHERARGAIPPEPSLITRLPERATPPPGGTCTVDLDILDTYLQAAGPPLVSQLSLGTDALTARSAASTTCLLHPPIPDLASAAARHLLTTRYTNHQALTLARMAIGPERTGLVEVPNALIAEALVRFGMDTPPPLVHLTTDA